MDYSDMSFPETDFHLSLKPPPTKLYDDEFLNPDQACSLYSDDVYPFADETTTFAPDAAADSLLSNPITEHDHDPAADTATGSLNQFTAEQTAAHKDFVNKLLSAIGPTIQESLQQCMKVCVAASIQAAQAVIDAQKSRDESSVFRPDNTPAASYLSPPPSLDYLNQTPVYDSDHEPTRFDTSFHTSAGSPPARELSSPALTTTDLSVKARKKARLRRKKKRAARLAATRDTADSHFTADWETRQASRLREQQTWQESKATRELDFKRQRAAQELVWTTEEAARKARSLEAETRKAIRDRQLKEDRSRRLAPWAEQTGQNGSSDGNHDTMITNRVTDNGEVLENTVEFS